VRELRLRALLLAAAYSVISHGVPHGDLGAIELPHVGLTLHDARRSRRGRDVPPRSRIA